MSLITFLSDFGESDHYVASVKAKIHSLNPDQKVIDLSHQVNSCDLAHAAYILDAVYRDFPEGTVHLIGVFSAQPQPDRYLAMKLNGHFFVGADNGLFGLIHSDINPETVRISSETNTPFPARDVLAPAAVKLARNGKLKEVGEPAEDYKRMLGRSLKATRSQIMGHVIRVDHVGNLITNIPREVFEELSHSRQYSITFGREQFSKIHEHYQSVDNGDCFVIFNSRGLLEIGINQGNAMELLGLEFDSPVMINFSD